MDLTQLQQDERDAMTGDRMAILRVVGALREYRALVASLLANRQGDGFTDLMTVESKVERIEAGEP